MRFYEEWKGFIFEYNSIGEYIKAKIGRLIGAAIAFVIIYILFHIIVWYGGTLE